MNKFKIQTLSDYGRLSDPATVILGISSIIPSLFPNLIGSEQTTMEVLNKLFPGNGYWTVQYKNYLLPRIKYVKDIQRDLHMYTGQFIEINQSAICPGKGGTDCWTAFYSLLQKESLTGGSSPVGNVFGTGFDLQTVLLVGAVILVAVVITKKKRSSSRRSNKTWQR